MHIIPKITLYKYIITTFNLFNIGFININPFFNNNYLLLNRLISFKI